MKDIKDKTKEYTDFIEKVRNGSFTTSKESYEIMRVYETDEADASMIQNGNVILYGIS